MTEIKMSPRQVLATYWERGKLPIDPELIAQKAGIKIEELDMFDSASGWYHPASEDGRLPPRIEVNRSEPEKRIRFTVAHELGHHFLQHGDRPRDTSQAFSAYTHDSVETEANVFAARLLMPREYVSALVVGKGITSLTELASRFGVSTVAMEIRLKTLGYI